MDKYFLKTQIFYLIIFLSQSGYVYANPVLFDKLPNSAVSNILDWVNEPVSKDNLCGGHFQQHSLINNDTASSTTEEINTIIIAKKIFYTENGDSILEGEASVKQPDHQIIADRIVLHRDAKTQKINNADFFGNVHFYELGKLVVANYGHYDFDLKTLSLDNAVYHLAIPNPTYGAHNLWGQVSHATRDKSQILTLYHASYSTCQPHHNAWHLTTSKLRLDKASGLGEANNAVLYVKNFPTFYFPYFQFPIDNRRRSGFLYPQISYSSISGLNLALPYYLNLAPNYDATITPQIMDKRGLLLNGEWRYLTSSNSGSLAGSFIYKDSMFKNYQEDSLIDYTNDPALPRLEKSSSNRGAVFFSNTTNFNEHLSSNLQINYASDDYFVNDFGSLSSNSTNDQLLNQAELKYADEHWQFLGRIQAFQTMHMLGTYTQDQYARLPQLNLTGYYPDEALGMNYLLNSEFVYFDHSLTDFYNPAQVIPIGARFNLNPSVNLPLNWKGITVTPRLDLPLTLYGLGNLPPNNPDGAVPEKNLTRFLPILSIDNSLILQRTISLLGNQYLQTLEPRIFYLYVPNVDQENIPIFDTNFSNVSLDNLFRINRFSSFDRVGDANQLIAALSSRFLDADSGAEKLRASIGQVFAFEKHHVCLNSNDPNCNNDPLAKNKISPIYGQLKYYLNSRWNFTTDVAWNTKPQQLSSADLVFQYQDSAARIINFGYTFLADGDNYNGQTVDLNRLNFSLVIPFENRWKFLGEWNYNVGYRLSQDYLYGLQYDTCCWALRLVQSRTYKSNNQYDNQTYLQILLKGLGTVGDRGVGDVLTNRILGFVDTFK